MIAALADLIVEVRDAAAAAEVVVDATATEVVDGLGVQLLCALARTVRGRGGALRWEAPGPALIGAARALGVAETLGLPEE